jgi:hypothetical protein
MSQNMLKYCITSSYLSLTRLGPWQWSGYIQDRINRCYNYHWVPCVLLLRCQMKLPYVSLMSLQSNPSFQSSLMIMRLCLGSTDTSFGTKSVLIYQCLEVCMRHWMTMTNHSNKRICRYYNSIVYFTYCTSAEPTTIAFPIFILPTACLTKVSHRCTAVNQHTNTCRSCLPRYGPQSPIHSGHRL